MDYSGNIFRPPSEANSILLQVTVGCSHNKCTFCEMYKDKRFNIKDDKTIISDIEYAAKNYTMMRRLFLCDGDALIVPQKKLLRYLSEINKKLPWLDRIGAYANTKSIGMKSHEQLVELRENGLKIAYMGLETGDDVTLKAIKKGATSEKMILMGRKLKKAGIRTSVTVLLGIAGEERSIIHGTETGRVLSEMDPDYVGALSLMLTPGTSLYKDQAEGKFKLPDAEGMLKELGTMVATTNLTNGLFHANHASNYLPIRAKMPEDKEKTLNQINSALNGEIALKPEHMRAL
ncbi:MAG: radical SAM protein [Desulfobacterales bacterium]|nr:radical SAM protein [Desulfobacterales bacterium]MCP4164098.1 radical SAM protein [Deltaproteobacteria bacterium]